MTKQKPLLLRNSLLGGLLLFPSPLLSGAGFQLAERSASGLGRAFSGETAIADDASVLSSNPAAMVLLGGDWNYAVGATYINPMAEVNVFPTFGPNAGKALFDDDIAESAAVPYLYLTKRINEDLVVGAGAFTTYGLRTNYSDSFASQVGTNYSDIGSINFNPSVGYRINDVISIGGGFNTMYADGELTSNSIAGVAPSFGLEGDDWAFGWNLGVLIEFTEQTRLGIHYRSKMELDLEGTATGSIFSPLGLTSSDASLAVELPAIAEVSLVHELNDQWMVHGDILWTQWSVFENLTPMVDTGIPGADGLINPALASPQDWEDTFRYSLGATYKHNDRWTFRAGVAYDESPVPDNRRNLRIPDGPRLWTTVGASYVLNKHMTIDAGYSYIFGGEVSLGENEKGLISTESNGEGDIQLFTLGMSGSF